MSADLASQIAAMERAEVDDLLLRLLVRCAFMRGHDAEWELEQLRKPFDPKVYRRQVAL